MFSSYSSFIDIQRSSDYPVIVYSEVFQKDVAKECERLADLASGHKWIRLVLFLQKHPYMVNMCRLPKFSKNAALPTLYTPLHHATNGKAPKYVFEALLDAGASKTLKSAYDETAYDIGARVNLNPSILDMIQVPTDIREREDEIKKMEAGLHQVIMGRVGRLIQQNGQQLPQLSYLYEFGNFFYVVPGMYGGYNVSVHDGGIETVSWCRVAGGSGQRHHIDREGSVKLVEEGFD